MKIFLLSLIMAALAVPAFADEICADRPAKATGTCTVKKGHWMVSDNTLVGLNHGTDQYVYFSPTIKYGLTNRIDLEAAMPFETVRSHSENVTGNGDLTLRVKYKIVYTGPVEFGIEPFIVAPVGHPELTNKVVQGGALIPIGVRLSNSWLLGFDPELDVIKNHDNDGTHLATQQIVALSHAVTNRVTVSGELWSEYNFDLHSTIREYSADAVFCYMIAKHFEVDTGVNFGLNRYTPAAQLFVGLSKRY